jgi:ATP-dependent helicase/nuclease subunit B
VEETLSMSVHLYVAPAAGGKTAYLVARARALAANLAVEPHVVVPSLLQARAWRRRLAEAGGALGVRVGTFDALYREVLRAAGQVYTRLTDPIQYRLLRLLAAEAPLVHYAPLRSSPGFVQVVLGLIRELKAGGVFPEALAVAFHGMGGEPRLVELADLYLAYQRHLQAELWADAAGIGWLAAEALEKDGHVGRGWPCVMVDGFDDLTAVQLSVLSRLAERSPELIVTLTGTTDSAPRRDVHRRFLRTQERLEKALGVRAEPLPVASTGSTRAAALAHLEESLFAAGASRLPAAGAVTLVAAPDREGEVRAALRWLKQRLIDGPLRLGEVALLARTIEPYRSLIQQVAAEFGLPVYMAGGLPLRGNPAVAALLDLLRLAGPGEGAFPWRQTVEAWRSPYLDWQSCVAPDGAPIGITPQDAEALDWVARWGSVVGGLDQWREALDRLVEVVGGPGQPLDEELPPLPGVLPTGDAARTLRVHFERFAARVTPPQGMQPCRALVDWVERLIGDAEASSDAPVSDLGMVRRAREASPDLQERDLAALNALKDVLRGLVWAEEALACAPMGWQQFLDDLAGAVNTTSYRVPLPADQEAVLVADVAQARGIPFSAVAVLGLAEGEFPAAVAEDPFLRDADRQRLSAGYQLEIDPSTESAEVGYFYEAITRPRDALLLTRSRIADNGAPWTASPFWEEVRRCVAVEPQRLSSVTFPPPEGAASWPELLLGVGSRAEDAGLWAWARRRDPRQCAALENAAMILRQRARAGGQLPGAHDGDLAAEGSPFAQHYGPGHTWSASRLESYRACPFFFFVGSALGLEPRVEPVEGLDAPQLGNLYHRIMEQLYGAVADPADLEQLLRALPGVVEPILDEAPHREGFRATAWWAQTRGEIVENVRDSLLALHALRGAYAPYAYERAFGIAGEPGPALNVRDRESGDTFRLRGFIDRVDRAPDGRMRIIDYKTGGPWAFSARAFEEGKKLQLPLYALAARDALGLGEIADGFYWHVRHAAWHLEHARSKSWFTLAGAGVRDAVERALGYAWEAVRAVREGRFSPKPPDDGCPTYCPAAAFCWQYAPRTW